MTSSAALLQILKTILECKEEMGDTMKTSFFSMTEAKYAAGDTVKHTIFDNVETAQVCSSPSCYSPLLPFLRCALSQGATC